MKPRMILLAVLAAMLSPIVLWGGRGDLNFQTALPGKKAAIEIVVRRNPFQAGMEPERPLPGMRDKDDPASKLPAALAGKIRSVIRAPRPLLLLEAQVVQPGDEVRLGEQPLLPKYKVVLKAIDDDRLVFVLTSLDQQQPGQVEAQVSLSPSMRKER